MTEPHDLIARFSAMFGAPRTDDPDLFIAEFERAISGIDKQLLAKAGDALMRSSKFWPKPSEVLDLVDKMASERERYERLNHREVEKHVPPPTPEQAARANALVAEFKRSLAQMDVSEKKDGKPANPVPDRTAFEGRWSPVFKCRWHAPPLADSDLVKRGQSLTARSRAMSGDRDE